ncbi:MAG: hypothetical protein R3C44_11845 [Chloroflexota bacterium]
MIQVESKVYSHSASRLIASAWGVLAGLGGLTHSIGELLQGNVSTESIIINTWTQGPIAEFLGGEPGMTLLPTMMWAGMATLLVSLAVIIWAAFFVDRPRGGLILVLLSIAMLLVGGGFAPPVMGILAGLAGTGINSPLNWWRDHLPAGWQSALAGLWPWLLGLMLAAGVMLVFGSVLLVYFLAFDHPDLFSNLFLVTLVLTPLTIVAGFAYDIQRQTRLVPA